MNNNTEFENAIREFYVSLGDQVKRARIESFQRNRYCDDICQERWYTTYVTISNLQAELKKLLEKHGIIDVIQVKIGGTNNTQENQSSANVNQIQVGGSNNSQVIK